MFSESELFCAFLMPLTFTYCSAAIVTKGHLRLLLATKA